MEKEKKRENYKKKRRRRKTRTPLTPTSLWRCQASGDV